MNRFARLFTALEQTTATSARTEALAAYLRDAPEDDRLWTIALLSGRRPKRLVNATELARWAAEEAGVPGWLFDESYAITGDLAETIALVLPEPTETEARSLTGWITAIRTLAGAPEAERRAAVLTAWRSLPATERFLFNKLITGGFRMGIAQGLMTRALARATNLPEADLAHRLMGDWSPETTRFSDLIAGDETSARSRPYPFCLAHPLEQPLEGLGAPEDWAAEWKWDGIRGQLIRRGGASFLWSRGEELVTDRYPEIASLAESLPDGTVIDGEILAFRERPLPFNELQKRIGRKQVGKKLLSEVPVTLMAYDLLELGGQDLRARPFSERRAALEALGAPFPLSPLAPFDTWDDLPAQRLSSEAKGAEGLMLKRLSSPYHAGRKTGDWWKWKLDPMTLDAVLIYAQAGHGRRAGLFTDFTFALWDGDQLVPVTKAYSGLTDAEFTEITRWVGRNTLERFGPVRRVTPELVFEIGFEGIGPSTRHKSGIALRFPRMIRWRRDKPAAEADRIEAAHALIAARQ